MKWWLGRRGLLLLLVGVAALMAWPWARLGQGRSAKGLVLVVMDTMAKRLACACVAGHAQREYSPLAKVLGQHLGQPLSVLYGESLSKALGSLPIQRVALLVGKQSVVQSDAERAGLAVRPIAQLTDKDGHTTVTGLFVVRAEDPAQTLADLNGRRVLFGPADAAEKHAAALAALRGASVPPPSAFETRPTCADAAMELQDAPPATAPAAVISSYALPLLEGCGSIEKGALRVIGSTAPVPFVTLFATDKIGSALEAQLREALACASTDAALLTTLESSRGFVSIPTGALEWPGWRGAARDGQSAWLPETLPTLPQVVWRKPLHAPAMAGVATASGVVVVADRDALDEKDVFQGLRAEDGELLWTLEYPAAGQLDYGLSPRAAPTIFEGKVYLLGALGALHCLELGTGRTLWQRDLTIDFGAKPPKWGWASSPLIVDDKVVVNPGSAKASLVALDRLTGRMLWQSPGAPAAYASFICDQFGGKKQIVGYDAVSLGGWDPKTGQRLWRLVPFNPGDFNVPTPIAFEGKLLVGTENNGTRLYRFTPGGRIDPKGLAQSSDLAPDASTPVVVQGKVLGCSGGLHCLDLGARLKTLWSRPEEALDFASFIVSQDRVLVTTFSGEIWLLAVRRDGVQLLAKMPALEPDTEIYSHPALADHRLFVRQRTAIICLNLER